MRGFPRLRTPLLAPTAAALLVAWALAIGSGTAPLGGQERAGAAQPPKPEDRADRARQKATKFVEPWPSAEALAERRVAAENLPLFKTTEPLAITLAADFKAVNRDRTVDSTKRFPGLLTLAGANGQSVAIPVRIGSRGNLRLDRRTCAFVPLRVELVKKDAAGTALENQGSLKLVTHCQDGGDYDQYVLGEYLAYRVINAITPFSFRVRLARATYVDASTGKTITTRFALFLEDQDDVARRMEGRIAPLLNRVFRNLDQPSLLRVMVVEFMLGNTDFSIYALHNVRLVQDHEGVLRPVVYDFDVTGIVNPLYAVPSPKVPITAVRQRLYRGPCVTAEDLEPTLAEIRAKRDEVLGLYDAQSELDARSRRDAKAYLSSFFDIIGDKARTKQALIDRCNRNAGM